MAGLKNSRILITGASGFIGSHLSQLLSEQRASVFGIDIAVHPHSYFIRNKIYKNIEFNVLDIRDFYSVYDFIDEYKPDYILHLAAKTLVTESVVNPVDTFETNIMGTVNILESVRRLKGVKGVIVASSDKAYGKTKDPYIETAPLRGDHPYDVSKSSADLISLAYHKTYGLPVVVTRFGNVYGEGDIHFDRIIPGLCRAIIDKQTFNIRSDGKYIRDYLYVRDVAEGYLTLLQNIEKIKGEAFNFASEESVSVLGLIQLIEKILALKVSYKILNNARNEIPYQHLNDSKIKNYDWKNKYTLKDTMPNILNWYRENA